jgi:NAD(P) transhydrogenase
MESYDIVVIGSGPAGHKAAMQGAQLAQRVLVIEQDMRGGGAGVHHGTIASKTLHESAQCIVSFQQRCAECFDLQRRKDLEVAHLMPRLQRVVQAHERSMGEQLQRNGVTQWHGRARFVSPHELDMQAPDGSHRPVIGAIIILATGSRPRTLPEVPVDQEHILDSDAMLSCRYLPASLTVLGSGVMACEYASIFAALGVQVTIIDRYDRPLGFMDAELTQRFVHSFEARGGRFLGQQCVLNVAWDGISTVTTTLTNGATIRSEKLLCTLGRVANIAGLNIAAAGLTCAPSGLLEVDVHCRTAVPHIYAVGDIIGPPALAACAMEQGRRAIRHALGLEVGPPPELIPMGLYTIPEMANVGLNEVEARQHYGGVLVGRARFDELVRGQIAGMTDGLLKLVAEPQGQDLLGV